MDAASSPQPLAVGELIEKGVETVKENQLKQSYADLLRQNQTFATSPTKFDLCPVKYTHGEPVVEFTMEEVNDFIREEGLHQATVVKFSYGKPNIQEIRKNLSSQFDVQGNCNVGQLDFRHILVRFDLYNDYVKFISKSTGYFKSKGEEYFFRTFPWSLGFKSKEETSLAVVWISFPGLPPNFFAKRSLMSIASAVGKAIAVDKATQERTRPSVARVKVILDLLDKHPNKVKLQIIDKVTGKYTVYYQEVVYDNLPKYCTCCKHQGHDEKMCHFSNEQSAEEKEVTSGKMPVEEGRNLGKLQGDAREYLNAKRAGQIMVETATNKVMEGQQQSENKTENQQAGELKNKATIGVVSDGSPGSAQAGLEVQQLQLADQMTDKQNVVQILGNEITRLKCSNTFDALLNKAVLGDADTNKQNVSQHLALTHRLSKSPGNDKQQQSRELTNAGSNSQKGHTFGIIEEQKSVAGTKVVLTELSNSDLDKMVNDAQNTMVVNTTTGNQAHISNTPTMLCSSARVVKDAKIAMPLHNNMVKQPFVTLNKSVFEIPSQSMDSFGEYGDESGQMVLSNENNDEVVKEKVRGTTISSKPWDDQSEYEDDEEGSEMMTTKKQLTMMHLKEKMKK